MPKQKLVTTVLPADDVASQYSRPVSKLIGGNDHNHVAPDELDDTWRVVSHTLQKRDDGTWLLSLIAEQA